ncbi:hypothetical protein MTO96_025457, partial [Rhipicephalus appendiculatus]
TLLPDSRQYGNIKLALSFAAQHGTIA